jgi:hypothetical protein
MKMRRILVIQRILAIQAHQLSLDMGDEVGLLLHHTLVDRILHLHYLILTVRMFLDLHHLLLADYLPL